MHHRAELIHWRDSCGQWKENTREVSALSEVEYINPQRPTDSSWIRTCTRTVPPLTFSSDRNIFCPFSIMSGVPLGVTTSGLALFVMFSPLSIGLAWFVCPQDYAKTTEWISMKLGEKMGHVLKYKPLHFGTDRDKGADFFALSLSLRDGAFFRNLPRFFQGVYLEVDISWCRFAKK